MRSGDVTAVTGLSRTRRRQPSSPASPVRRIQEQQSRYRGQNIVVAAEAAAKGMSISQLFFGKEENSHQFHHRHLKREKGEDNKRIGENERGEDEHTTTMTTKKKNKEEEEDTPMREAPAKGERDNDVAPLASCTHC